MSDTKNLNHNRKKDFLSKEVEHIDITSFDSRKIISSMEKMSFVSRETANASKIYNEMLKDKDCTIFLTLAGSTSAAGCMHIYRDMVKYNMVDAIVATGASIIDMDFFEALGFKHYQGSQYQNDNEPLDSSCTNLSLNKYSKNYLNHLFNTNEILASMILTLHNINFYQELMSAIRENIKKGTFDEFHDKYINKL